MYIMIKKKKGLEGKKCFKLDCGGVYVNVCVCQNSQKCTLKRMNFPVRKYIIQRRKKIGAGYLLTYIKMNFNKLFQSKQGTWVPNIKVK